MRSYLRKDERTDYLIMKGFQIRLNYIIKTWEKYLTKEEKKNIKTANTMLNKFIWAVESGLDSKQWEQLLRDANRWEVMLVSKKEVDKELEKESKEKYQTIEKEKLFSILEHSFLACENCKEDYTRCEFRSILMDLYIEPFNADAVNSCQYKIEIGGNTDGNKRVS